MLQHDSSKVINLPFLVFSYSILLWNLFFFTDLFTIMWGSQGLQEKIKLVPIDLQNRPAWYKEKVYSVNNVKLHICHIFFIYLDVNENILLHLSSLEIKGMHSTSKRSGKMKEASLITNDIICLQFHFLR